MVARPRRGSSHTLCRRSSRTLSPACSRATFSTVSAALLSSCHTQAFLSSSATSFTRGATRSTTTSTPRKVTLLWVRSTKDLLPSTLDSVVQHPYFLCSICTESCSPKYSFWMVYSSSCMSSVCVPRSCSSSGDSSCSRRRLLRRSAGPFSFAVSGACVSSWLWRGSAWSEKLES